MKRFAALFAALALVLSACSPSMGPKEGTGTLLGAGAGALAGSQIGSGRGRIVAVAIGTLAGAILGQEIGKSLDRADQLTMQRNAQYALENTRTNTTTTWVNPDSGNSGSFTPVQTYQSQQGTPCREYVQRVLIGGVEHEAYGTACRQADGSWKIIQ